MTGRFDSLVHVTRDGHWLNGRCDASRGRLIAELDRAAIGRACLVGLPGVVDNDYVLDQAHAEHGRLVPIAGFNPREHSSVSALATEVASLARAGFAGLKLHPRLNGYDPLDPWCTAVIAEASARGLVVYVDTLFRQRNRPTQHAADLVDRLAHACPDAPIVLVHGGGPSLLELTEVVRVHGRLVLDLSYTLLKYAGTSLDADMRWAMLNLDQRLVIGSDMPEFTPTDAFARAEKLAAGIDADKWANITHRNLERLFDSRSA